MIDRSTLRQQMRARRQLLTQQEQISASATITKLIIDLPVFQARQHIATYIANENEIDPSAIIQMAWQQHKNVYLPVIQAPKTMCFVKYNQNTLLVKNKFNIPEPELTIANTIAADKLDLVLVPLVAFDKKGNRLGMGSGFYDNTFAFLSKMRRPTKPYLIGLAYEWQCCANILAEAWDVKLDAIATEKQLHIINYR